MTRRLGIALIVAFMAISIGAYAQRSAKQELASAYAQISKGVQKKDISVLSRLSAPDYKQRDLSGKEIGREEALGAIQQTFAVAKSVTMNVSIAKVESKPNQAIATVRWVMTMVTMPELDPKRKTHKVIASVPLKHTWVKSDKGWLLKLSEELAGAKVTLDGKPQKPDRR